MRRGLSIGLAALLLLAVVITILVSRGGGSSARTQTVRGVIGSEKQPFFDDPDVKAAFKKAGLDVEVDTAGSRQIATQVDLSKYDFAFPAGTPQAERIRIDRHIARTYVPFSTPMAIATFDDVAQLLGRAGVATDHGGWWSFDVQKYLDLVRRNTRWNDLPGNTTYPVAKQLLITSTDVTTSNSAAMYASIASYVLNGDNVVTGESDVTKVYDLVSQLFIRQGFQEQSSEEPFDDYLSIGEGKTPMVMIYEAQFVARAALHDGSITSHMVLMYPDPDIVSKHTLVPLTSLGDRVGQLLTTDPTLQRLEVKYGFRTATPGAFNDFVAKQHVQVAPQLLDIIEPPTYDNLEALILAIANREQTGDAAATSTTTSTPTTTHPIGPSTTGAP
jgi:hypothetical protein